MFSSVATDFGPYTNDDQSVGGVGGLGIIRGNKVGESEYRQ